METLDPGTPFGAYTIEGLIAGGGMGSVYVARHTVYGTTCALKVLHPKLHHDDGWRRRFEAEGFAGTTLKHPHVLAAREVILEDNNQIGLVLDLVKEGMTLHRVMSREFPTGLPLVQSLRVLLGLVQGIEYAHGKEIVHGDIKPENVLIQGDLRDPDSWVPKLTDFGTVGILAHPVEIDGQTAVVVSPRYASPEHIKGMAQLEPRSDIYCLGLLLHYMLTGRHASVARTVEEAAQRVAEPTTTTALMDQPEALIALFMKATERRADDRFATARDLALAIRDLLDSLGEGLELEDVQADLATEIMEERREAARSKRIEAHQQRLAEQAAARAAQDSLPAAEPDDADAPPAPRELSQAVVPPASAEPEAEDAAASEPSDEPAASEIDAAEPDAEPDAEAKPDEPEPEPNQPESASESDESASESDESESESESKSESDEPESDESESDESDESEPESDESEPDESESESDESEPDESDSDDEPLASATSNDAPAIAAEPPEPSAAPVVQAASEPAKGGIPIVVYLAAGAAIVVLLAVVAMTLGG